MSKESLTLKITNCENELQQLINVINQANDAMNKAKTEAVKKTGELEAYKNLLKEIEETEPPKEVSDVQAG